MKSCFRKFSSNAEQAIRAFLKVQIQYSLKLNSLVDILTNSVVATWWHTSMW